MLYIVVLRTTVMVVAMWWLCVMGVSGVVFGCEVLFFEVGSIQVEVVFELLCDLCN